MTKKALRGLAKRAAASNRAFAKMSPARKRVAVAEDVLKALALRQIRPTSGSYLSAHSGKKDAWGEHIDLIHEMVDDKGTESLQKLLPALPPCNVCAKGALFVCTVARRNKVTVRGADRQSWDGHDLSRALGGIFPAAMLDMIESEFEGGMNRHTPVMGLYSKPPATRMRLIMKNIIANKGEFRPEAA